MSDHSKKPSQIPKRAASQHSEKHKGITGFTEFCYGLLVAIVLLAAKIAFVEHTAFGQKVERLGYEWLQSWVSSDNDPVVVIDTSRLIRTPEELDTTEKDENGQVVKLKIPLVTPISDLRKIVSTVLAESPCAVGIDINFAAFKKTNYPFVTPDRLPFADYCTNQSVPIFLGVGAIRTDRPDEERSFDLIFQNEAYEKYRRLLVAIAVRRYDRRAMPDAVIQKVPSMSTALANAYMECRGNSTSENRNKWYANEIVDFSSLQRTEKDTIDYRQLATKAGNCNNKIVLIGCVQCEDSFVVPGFDEPVAGVYLHACAAATLVNGPLYELNWRGRLIADGILTLLLLTIFALPGLVIPEKILKQIDRPKLQWVSTITIVIALVGFVVCVQYTRLLWSDFLVVIPAILLHSSAEHFLVGLWKNIKDIFWQWIRIKT